MRGLIAWMIVLCAACGPLFGADYFVRTSGRNSNAGTSPSSAWQTVAYAASRMQPGDTVYVGAGYYSGQLYLQHRGGTEGSYLRFVADTDGARTGDAGTVQLYASGSTLYLENVPYAQFQGFTISNSSGTLVFNSNSLAVRMTDCTLSTAGTALHAQNGGGWVVDGCSISSSGGHAVYMAGGALVMTDSTVMRTGSSSSAVHLTNQGTLTIDGCSLNAGNDIIYSAGGTITITDTTLANARRNGLFLSNQTSMTMDRCTIKDVATRFMYLDAGTITLTNCVMDGSNETGIQTMNQTRLSVVQCTINDTVDEGIISNGTTVVYNTIFANIGKEAMERDNGSFTAASNLVYRIGDEVSKDFASSEITGDPLFVDPSAGEFGLQEGSPARNAGRDCSAYTSLDRSGDARPQGSGWDIGAYEGFGLSRTIYVRQGGSDDNTGRTPEQAFRTIQRAIEDCVGSGYTVYVGPGTYREAVSVGTGSGLNAASGTVNAPNQIIADIAGIQTGDIAGAVVLSGGGSLATALSVSNRSGWVVDGFTVTGYTQYGVMLNNNGGLAVRSCTLDRLPYAGVFLIGSEDSEVTDCSFEMSDESSYAILGLLWQQSGADLVIERNRVVRSGEAYLSSPYRNGEDTLDYYPYAILAYVYSSSGGTMTVRNNIISDSYVGLYAWSYNSGAVTVANNTIAGCTYPAYVSASSSGSVVNNTIISQCYYGLANSGSATVTGLCEFGLGTDPAISGLERSNMPTDIITTDPMFTNAAGGDFSLIERSACIDAGTITGAPATDIDGRSRPDDGDGDEVAVVDLGAVELVTPGENQRVRVVRWREVSPVEDE
jgi:hypothetical protein